VPETLHALIAARLDGLSAEERRLLEDGAVLGKTFTVAALSALSGRARPELETLLTALVRKEVLGVQADARAPEHGQYGFLQDLVRHVAYETLSRRERKVRHLAAAEYLTGAFADVEEVAEVLAAHYVAAFRAAPDADDAADIRRDAREMLARAGARAGSLGAPDEGQRYFEQAAELADQPLVEAELLERAARLGLRTGRRHEARAELERAIALFESAGQMESAARAMAGLVDFDFLDGRVEEVTRRIEEALPLLDELGPTPELAETLAQLGRIEVLRGDREQGLGTLERALRLAEKLGLEEVFLQALTSKAISLIYEGRFAEGRVLLEGAMERARAGELHSAWLRAANNLGVVLQDTDRLVEVLELSAEIEARARQLGDRGQLAWARLGNITPLVLLARWPEALALGGEAEEAQASQFARFELVDLACIHCELGDVAEAEKILATEGLANAEHPEMKATVAVVEARLRRAQGLHAEALAAAERGLAVRHELSIANTRIKRAFVEAVEAALALGDLSKAGELLADIEALRRGELTPFLAAQRARFRARLDSIEGREQGIDGNYRSAAAIFREFGFGFYLAVTQLEQAEWLSGKERFDEAAPLLAEAQATFEQLEARPWLERAASAFAVQRDWEALPGA
jgi:tetratricopeptide (TPR) repeat protein